MQPGMTSTELPYHPMDETSPAPARDYHGLPSPLGAGSLSRKRTFSVFEGLPNSSFTQPLNSRSSQHAFGLFPTFLRVSP